MRLLEIAGNRWRNQIVADLRKVMKLNRHHSLFKQGRIAESLAEHRAIMEAHRGARRQGGTRADARAFRERAGGGSVIAPNNRIARFRPSRLSS